MKTTTFNSTHGTTHTAVFLTWAEVETILGAPHDGNPWQDETIIRHIASNSGPQWVLCRDRAGHIDEAGWWIYRP